METAISAPHQKQAINMYIRFMQSDELYMRRCIELAVLGTGKVAPNPLVGAVIVHHGKIIGEGYHQKYGEAHSEVNAVNSVSNKDLLSEATIYVSLEPCAHHGKTPPCADLIVKHNFKRVVIGCTDSFDQVSGKGTERIRNAGIDVTLGVLEKECRKLNKRFFTFHEKKRPFIFLKWAQSINGKLDNKNKADGITWISAPEIQSIVHQWRSEYQGILVGRNTVEHDNPSLTVRKVAGTNPTRVVLDSNLRLPDDLNVFSEEAPTIVLNTLKSNQEGNVRYEKLDSMTPTSIANALFEANIQSVLIEGGAQTLQSFIDADLWDEACVIEGQLIIQEGTQAPDINGTPTEVRKCFGDTLNFYSNL